LPDVVDIVTRSRMMSGIRGKNTKPEMLVRLALHRRGFRYRLHARNLPGRPDIVLPKFRAAVFVNGCFWHGHDCELFRLPATRTEFWSSKITSNRARDARNLAGLRTAGWRSLVIWECALRPARPDRVDAVVDETERWIRSDRWDAEIRRTT
jgi:DNA mismatch endonuclease (patch repair protein)